MTTSRGGGVRASVLEAVGSTPLVALDRLAAGTGCRIVLKTEHLNPGGSHKARIALNMVLAAEREGVLVRGSGQTIVEPTGGNTGMGIAMAGAVLGYRVVLVIPDNYSKDKQRVLAAMGAEILLSDSSTGNNSHGELANRLVLENPTWVLLNQGANPNNPDAHRNATALEILDDLDGEPVDHMVAGIGTGGHITGVGEILRKEMPDLRVHGVQPEGCDLFAGTFRRHRVQGLSVGYVPPVLNRDVVDDMITVGESEAVECMKLLMRTEGIAAGPSTGANIAAALRLARSLDGPATILTFAYDGAHDYLDLLSDPTDAVVS
ncbi:PLP-dependent cysteine synthase family protein [Kitasatospora sp. NPDC001540]|uniref:PLP-dependent cysteine synthase family protein n=1 Tax=Kitasatospora sp. NPDC001540 TaxID=3364014 RepID=UPI0036B0DCEE